MHRKSDIVRWGFSIFHHLGEELGIYFKIPIWYYRNHRYYDITLDEEFVGSEIGGMIVKVGISYFWYYGKRYCDPIVSIKYGTIPVSTGERLSYNHLTMVEKP